MSSSETVANGPRALEAILSAAPVVPVLVVDDWKAAVPLARALVGGGLTAIEITLRTGSALEALRAVAAEVEGAQAGAGTVLTHNQFSDAVQAGARFVVSPGVNPALLEAADEFEVPFLPGSSTASEAMTLFEYGYPIQKFFPAEPAGGIAYLKALGSPLPGIRFCPTGGIDATNAASYLALANVVCVGGSWVAPRETVANADWNRIARLAREAASLGRGA